MTYIPSLHKIQIGVETVYDDAAAGTIQLPGITNVQIDPKVEVEQLSDLRGDTMPSHESLVKRRWTEGIIEGYVNYDEFYLYLDGMFGKATPVGNVRTYSGSGDWSVPTESSLCIRYGQTGALYQVPGVLPYELQLSGATGEPLKFSYSFFGTPVTDGASFAALSDDVVDWAMGHDTTICFDAGASAAPGTTTMSGIAFRFDARISCDRKPVWHLGDQEHDAYNRGKWSGSMKLVFEADTTMLGYIGDVIDNLVTGDDYAVRIRSTDASNILDLDFVGTVVNPPRLITDLDGIVTAELELLPTYGSNAAMLSCWGAEITIP
jgi:hypothetical protein